MISVLTEKQFCAEEINLEQLARIHHVFTFIRPNETTKLEHESSEAKRRNTPKLLLESLDHKLSFVFDNTHARFKKIEFAKARLKRERKGLSRAYY